MLGYMTKADALSRGFTHHGAYYGIPCWIGGLESVSSGALRVATKWAPMELVMTLFHAIEGALRPLKFPYDPPMFQFQVGAPIRTVPTVPKDRQKQASTGTASH